MDGQIHNNKTRKMARSGEMRSTNKNYDTVYAIQTRKKNCASTCNIRHDGKNGVPDVHKTRDHNNNCLQQPGVHVGYGQV